MSDPQTTPTKIATCQKCGNQYGAAFKCHHLGHPEIQEQEKREASQDKPMTTKPAQKIINEMRSNLRAMSNHREWFADSKAGLDANIACDELLNALDRLEAKI